MNGWNSTKFYIHFDIVYRLGLFYINLRKLITELWPSAQVRISFPLNILEMNGGNLTKFCICIDIDKIHVGIVMHQFVEINNRVVSFESRQNFDSAQYLKRINELN